MRAPDFWNRNGPLSRLAVAALSPIGQLYGASIAWKAKHTTSYRAAVPVVCIGNITAGGTGKTPIAIAIADAVIARGKNPFFLTRGYGGRLKGPLVVGKEHTATDVGDEPLLLARKAATVVARDRRAGAKRAVQRGADIIIMDDGHQNFALAKDLSIVVVDGETGFGNGHMLPAGPLREPVSQGLGRADSVIIVGAGEPALPGFCGPVLRGHVEAVTPQNLMGQRVLAFAGIGRPEKFFDTLRTLGAELAATVEFSDHHPYTPEELADLKTKADALEVQLMTTEKDYVRLAEGDRAQIAYLPIRTTLAPLDDLDRLLDRLDGAR